MFLKHLFSTDHKVIGLLYAFTSLLFLLVGFSLVVLIRWQLAYPGQPVPLIGAARCGKRAGRDHPSEFFNQLGAMHGTIMVFLGVVPLAVGAFGNYIVPLQIGAPDMAFPRLNLASYWFYLAGGVVMLGSFFVPGGAANNGWTSYPPLSDLAAGDGQTWWLVGMLLLIFSSLLGALNFITTIFNRARTWCTASPCRRCGEAGRDSGDSAARVVYADGDRRMGDRVLATVWAGPLSNERLLRHPDTGRLQRLAGEGIGRSIAFRPQFAFSPA